MLEYLEKRLSVNGAKDGRAQIFIKHNFRAKRGPEKSTTSTYTLNEIKFMKIRMKS